MALSAQRLCRESRTVIQQAQRVQTDGGIFQADSFQATNLKAGSKIYRLCQDSTHLYQNSWYFEFDDLANCNFDYNTVYEGLQVPKRYPNYKVAEYTLTEDIYVATGKALNNTQFGVGGFKQYFIYDWQGKVVFTGNIFDLINIP